MSRSSVESEASSSACPPQDTSASPGRRSTLTPAESTSATGPASSVLGIVAGLPCQFISGASRGRANKPDLWPALFSCLSASRRGVVVPSLRFYETLPPSGSMRSGSLSARASSVLHTTAPGRLWLPTPTAKANHSAPSMRKWPAYIRFQDRFPGPIHPRTFEWMMGFPIDHTASDPSETP